jgi:putative oxidoreductase
MKFFSSKYTDNALSFGLLILRLTMGLIVKGGYDKLMDHSGTAAGLKQGNFPMPDVSAWLLIFAEFFCAILIILGFATRFAVIPLIIAMGIATLYAHDGRIFGDGQHAALFMGGCLALLFTGPGKYSIDRIIGK